MSGSGVRRCRHKGTGSDPLKVASVQHRQKGKKNPEGKRKRRPETKKAIHRKGIVSLKRDPWKGVTKTKKGMGGEKTQKED